LGNENNKTTKDEKIPSGHHVAIRASLPRHHRRRRIFSIEIIPADNGISLICSLFLFVLDFSSMNLLGNKTKKLHSKNDVISH
jgi:hypothetical protein